MVLRMGSQIPWRKYSLFPMRPRVALLFVLFSGECLDSKPLRALLTNGLFGWLTAHIANAAGVFTSGV